jgi:hypothetical protein
MFALAAYQQAGDTAALPFTLADANRLVATHIVSAGAWWYPYQFDFELAGQRDVVARAPWYSAMAQGQVLQLFTRLYEQTHDPQWRTAAVNTFASFMQPYAGSDQIPWVDNVALGYLWLQEYPSPEPDYTINGAFFATFGLVEYAITFGDSRAARIADGSLTTLLHYIGQAEHPGWISSYSLGTSWDLSGHYHGIVTQQLAISYTITHDLHFAVWATRFNQDYPIVDNVPPTSAIALSPGTYTLAQTHGHDRIGNAAPVLGARLQVMFAQPTTLDVDVRWEMQNDSGYWYRIIAGPYTHDWIQESATVHLPGPVNLVYYDPPASFTLSGTYQLYTYQQGQLQLAGTFTAQPEQAMALSQHATIDGQDAWQVGSGPDAGDYLSGLAPQLNT